MTFDASRSPGSLDAGNARVGWLDSCAMPLFLTIGFWLISRVLLGEP